MIDFLKGDVVSRHPTEVILQVGGIGYCLQIPLSTYERMPEKGEAALLTYLHVREDALKLFGFATAPEREMFLLLMSVSGVGPGIALTALSGSAVEQLKAMILSGDADGLQRIKGIGKKTSERIILELKEVVQRVSVASPAWIEMKRGNLEDAVLGLTSLGYSRGVAQQAVRAAAGKLGQAAKAEDLLREALMQI